MTVRSSTVTREAGTSKPSRRPTRRRLSASHLLIATVAILAFALNVLALRSRDATTLVAVADRPLAAGSVFNTDSVRMIEAPADFEALESLIEPGALAEFDGWVLQRSVAPGGLFDVGAFVEPGASDGLRSMSVPIDVEHAAGGTIGAGDRVDVISVVDGTASFIGTDIEVVSVAELSGGSLGAIGDYHIVVAVEAEQALRLAEAIDVGSIEIVRSTGAAGADTGVGVDEP